MGTGAIAAVRYDLDCTCDENGNRTTTGYSTGDNNQLLSDGTCNYYYTYDEGNRTRRTESHRRLRGLRLRPPQPAGRARAPR